MPRNSLKPLLLLLSVTSLSSAMAGETLRGFTHLTNSVSLQATVRTDAPGEGHTSRPRSLVNCRGSQLSWVMPNGYWMNQAGPDRVGLCSSDRKRFVQLRVLDVAAKSSDALDSSLFRQVALNSHPGAVVAGESTRSAGGFSGPAFDLQWSIAGNSGQAARVLFVPSPAGILEIKLVCLEDDFAGALIDLNTILVTFTSAPPGGSLEIEPLSDML